MFESDSLNFCTKLLTKANYVQYPEDALTTSTITQTTKPTSMLYVAYNRERTTWELHNDATMRPRNAGSPHNPITQLHLSGMRRQGRGQQRL